MHTTASETHVELLRAAGDDDGPHSSERLTARLRRGELLRVRRGIYLDAGAWLESPRWRRHQIAAASDATAGSPLFCRETALMLHGLPVLHLPDNILIRSASRGRVAIQPEPTMTGRLTVGQFLRRYSGPQVAGSRLRNITKKYVEPALPSGVSRPEFRAAIAAGSVHNPETRLPPDALQGISGPQGGYRVEPVGLAVVDTVSRLAFTDAVVVLDAVKAREDIDVEQWFRYLRTGRQRRRFQRAWEFADPAAESALESESRAVLHELGFPPPTLQRVVQTRMGTFRLDMCWEHERVVGEVDGRSKYLDQQYTAGRDAYEIHYAEKQRREAIEDDGWAMTRWGKQEVAQPERLARRLARVGLVPQR